MNPLALAPAWKAAAVALAVLLGLGYTPASVYTAVGTALSAVTGYVWTTVKLPPVAPDTLKAAILNVTTDFDELCHLVQEFMRGSQGPDPSVEAAFRTFLAERATRSYPRLESILDWLLSLYKFAFPFLVISLVHRLSNGGGDGGGERGRERQEELRRREHRRHAPGAAAEEAEGEEGPLSAPAAHPGAAATTLSRLRTQASWGREQREGSPLGPDTPSDHHVLPPLPSHARGGAAKPRRHTSEIHADGGGRHWAAV